MGEIVLEELTVVFGATGGADSAAEVTVEFECPEGGVSLRVEGVDVCELALSVVLVL